MSRIRSTYRRLWGAAVILPAFGTTASTPPEVPAAGPLEVFDFYIGTIVPTDLGEVDFTSDVRLEWGVGRQAIRFTGNWTRDGEPPEFVNGLVAWDPVAGEIRITGVFFHGAYFVGTVRVLDADRGVVRREWEGAYPDGSVVPYRETWTPLSDDTFEWSIEAFRDGAWHQHLPPGIESPPVHRVIRAGGRSRAAQEAPPQIVLEGRESVEQVGRFERFFGRWVRVEYPRGTPIENADGGCFFRPASYGMVVEVGCGPFDEPAEFARVFWNPIDDEFVFRLYSVRYPADLLFEGTYEFPSPESVRRTYRGLYGDGRIHLYRETWTLEAPDRLIQVTERFQQGTWGQIFDTSVYERLDDGG